VLFCTYFEDCGLLFANQRKEGMRTPWDESAVRMNGLVMGNDGIAFAC
jgi:hypothetical protein